MRSKLVWVWGLGGPAGSEVGTWSGPRGKVAPRGWPEKGCIRCVSARMKFIWEGLSGHKGAPLKIDFPGQSESLGGVGIRIFFVFWTLLPWADPLLYMVCALILLRKVGGTEFKIEVCSPHFCVWASNSAWTTGNGCVIWFFGPKKRSGEQPREGRVRVRSLALRAARFQPCPSCPDQEPVVQSRSWAWAGPKGEFSHLRECEKTSLRCRAVWICLVQ